MCVGLLLVILDELLEVRRFVVEVNFGLPALLKGSLHTVFNPSRHLRLYILDSLVQPRCQVLHLEETLIDQRFSFPNVNVLTNESICDQLKHLTGRDGNVVP